MKTTESKSSTSHSSAPQKPFFGASPDHAFFSTERAQPTPFFQPQAVYTPTIQVKSADVNEEEVQRMPAFESEITSNGEVHRKLINYPQHWSPLPIQAKLATGERKKFLTRILRPEQIRSDVGTRSVFSSQRSLRRNLVERLEARGTGTTIGSRIYSYMRKFGGAGIQGFHRESSRKTRAEVVRGILQKMNADPKRVAGSSRGKKFVMVVTHPQMLGRKRVYDLKTPRTKKLVLSGKRAKYTKMYQQHQIEGVVAVDGAVSRDEVLAMKAFQGVPEEKELESIIKKTLDVAEERLSEVLKVKDI